MLSHVAFTIFATLMLVLSVLGAPTPIANTADTVQLEERTTHVGRGTWFNVGMGNCGKWNKDSDAIVAISKTLYDQNHGSNCDQYVQITDETTGKTTYALTRDSCPSCGYNDLDMSPSTFQKLASLGQGVVKISWHFMERGWHP